MDKVQRPMDFGTIKSNLEAGLYPTPEDFDKDVQQVFINARLYNAPDQDVYKMAQVLEVGAALMLSLTVVISRYWSIHDVLFSILELHLLLVMSGLQ